MAVPAHDERDFEFAKQYRHPHQSGRRSRRSLAKRACCSSLAGQEVLLWSTAVAINSGEFDGLTTAEFKNKITAWLAENGVGREAVNYKLRDWLFSRQRFWGEPFPILHELDDEGNPTGRVRAVPEADLPVDLPHLEDFKPHGRPEPPLDKAPDEWLYQVIDGVRYKRETNTMPQWAGSCWYYLRFLDPDECQGPHRSRNRKGLDAGRSVHRRRRTCRAASACTRDFGTRCSTIAAWFRTPEPFQKLVNQGMILGENNEKMSKSRGNVINPDTVVKEYGADSLRLYEMFMGPLEATKPWSMEGVNGVFGFLNRVWRMILDDQAGKRSRSTRRFVTMHPQRNSCACCTRR